MRVLSLAYLWIGDVLMAQRDLGEATEFFRKNLSTIEPLAKRYPLNAAWQRDCRSPTRGSVTR